MTNPNFFILYVDNPLASAAFYAELLEKEPIEASPTFAMFNLEAGFVLGLWSKHTVEPKAEAVGGGCELAIVVADIKTVDALHENWRKREIIIKQAPCAMDFGYTFVALDPDGHRLRVFAPSAS